MSFTNSSFPKCGGILRSFRAKSIVYLVPQTFAPQHAHLTGTRKKGLREGVAREDHGGGAADVRELDGGFFMVKPQPSRVPSVLAGRMTWLWANFVNDPPSHRQGTASTGGQPRHC